MKFQMTQLNGKYTMLSIIYYNNQDNSSIGLKD